MNKLEAVAYLKTKHDLNVSSRSLENYVHRGLLPREYVKGKTRDVADFQAKDLDALAVELQHPRARETSALMENRTPLQREQFAMLLNFLIDELGGQRAGALALPAGAGARARTPAPVDVKDKLTLTLKEAAELSGFSKDYLRAALRSKKLKGAKRGPGWNIKRADLEAWVKKL